MYYEEKVIDTVHGQLLACRTDPEGEWHIFTPAELTAKYEKLRYAAFSIANDVEDYLEDHDFIDDPLGLLANDVQDVRKAL